MPFLRHFSAGLNLILTTLFLMLIHASFFFISIYYLRSFLLVINYYMIYLAACYSKWCNALVLQHMIFSTNSYLKYQMHLCKWVKKRNFREYLEIWLNAAQVRCYPLLLVTTTLTIMLHSACNMRLCTYSYSLEYIALIALSTLFFCI